MWPVILGAGAIAILAKALFEEDDVQVEKKRIFISFAIEDEKYRDFLVKQAKLDKSPFTFTDMSVKQPWSEAEWKKRCRTKIKRCDGMIVLLSKNTWHSSGARWEIKCAIEEGVPVIGMHVKKKDKGAIPPELKGKKIIEWTWDNLEKTINKM
jgi:hypothetical protein